MKQKLIAPFAFLLTILIKTTLQYCNDDNCPSESGECIDDICLCAPGYTTLKNYRPYGIFTPSRLLKKQYCNYPYIYKDWAIYFEMIIPMGVGHFYARRYLHALFKFILFWYLSFVKVIYKKRIRAYPQLKKMTTVLLYFFCFLYVLDYFGFNFGFYLDGYRMKLI